MLTWFQAGLVLGENHYENDTRLGLISSWGDPCGYFLFCTGARTARDYDDFCAGVEAAKEMS